jgi:GAF domain-containing protein
MATDRQGDQPGLHAELVGLLLSEQTVSGLLEMIARLAISAIGSVSGSSITLMSPNGRLETTAASSDTIRIIDEGQYRDGKGPCVQAVRTDAEVTATLPRGHWPDFSSRALQAGMHSVHSFPLQVRDQTTGALNLYSTHENLFEGTELQAARGLAHQAATVLANASALTNAELANQQLAQALATRDLIGQAKGILMARENIDADAAFDLLRRVSQRTGRKLKDIAAEVAANPSRLKG